VLDAEEASKMAERKKKREMMHRLRALDFTYHDKNLYAINNVGFGSLSVILISGDSLSLNC
jgi:hypothetical protein